jgi:hypothetical protein
MFVCLMRAAIVAQIFFTQKTNYFLRYAYKFDNMLIMHFFYT